MQRVRTVGLGIRVRDREPRRLYICERAASRRRATPVCNTTRKTGELESGGPKEGWGGVGCAVYVAAGSWGAANVRVTSEKIIFSMEEREESVRTADREAEAARRSEGGTNRTDNRALRGESAVS